MERLVRAGTAAALMCWSAAAFAAPAPLDCTDADTGETYKADPAALKVVVPSLQKLLKDADVHLLDFSEDTQDGSRALVRHLAAKDWCAAAKDANELRADLEGARVYPEFVTRKFSRIERWVRGATWTASVKKNAERLLANAAAEMSDGAHVKANSLLNQVYPVLFRTKTLWDLPKELPQVEVEIAGGVRAEITEAQVDKGCPTLGKKGRASKKDLRATLRKLEKALNTRRIRASDIKDGEALVQDMKSYIDLDAIWPAIRVSCALMARADATEIDLGFAMARFQRVSRLRRDKELPEADDAKFRELVRLSSDAIAAQDFVGAHNHLESLLVFLGEPASPAATVQ